MSTKLNVKEQETLDLLLRKGGLNVSGGKHCMTTAKQIHHTDYETTTSSQSNSSGRFGSSPDQSDSSGRSGTSPDLSDNSGSSGSSPDQSDRSVKYGSPPDCSGSSKSSDGSSPAESFGVSESSQYSPYEIAVSQVKSFKRKWSNLRFEDIKDNLNTPDKFYELAQSEAPFILSIRFALCLYINDSLFKFS